MWNYEKRLQYPVNIKKADPKLAQVIITQFGGPLCKKGEFFFESLSVLTSRTGL